MAILDNPMAALGVVNRASGVAGASHSRNGGVIAIPAGVGDHGLYSCCGLCKDASEHRDQFSEYVDLGVAAVQVGDEAMAWLYEALASTEREAFVDASNAWVNGGCGSLTELGQAMNGGCVEVCNPRPAPKVS